MDATLRVWLSITKKRMAAFCFAWNSSSISSGPQCDTCYGQIKKRMCRCKWLNWYAIDLLYLPTLMHKFIYSLTICMLHYNPRHVSSINMPIFRRTNFIVTAPGIVTVCKRLYSMLDESRLCRVCSHPAYCTVLYSTVQRVTTPDAVIIKFVLLKMGMLMLETFRGL